MLDGHNPHNYVDCRSNWSKDNKKYKIENILNIFQSLDEANSRELLYFILDRDSTKNISFMLRLLKEK